MRATRLRHLLLAAFTAGLAAWAVTQVRDAVSTDLPRVPGSAPLAMLLLAAMLAAAALAARRRLSPRPGVRPLDPLLAARLVAFAKASAWVGATVAGGYVGFALALVDDLSTDARRDRVVLAFLTAAAAVVAMVAAVLLERVLRVPPPSDRTGRDGPERPA